MKIYYLLLTGVCILLFSCSQQQQPAAPAIMAPLPTKLVGRENKARNALPVITELTTANLPKTVPAGKPVVVPNPNADGLGDPDFTHYGKEQGLALDNTTSALLDRAGNLWFTSWGGGVSRYDGKHFTVYAAANGMDNGINHMAQDSAGNFWFDAGGYLYKYDGVGFESDTNIIKLGTDISCITVDKKGDVWFGTSNGLIEYESATDGRFIKIAHYTTAQGLINNRVFSIWEDRSGNLWLGTRAGVSRFDGIHFSNFTKQDGLIANTVFAIEQDMFGDIWFGTDSGASRYDGNRFANYTKKQGLVSNGISVIEKDGKGNVWFGTDSGVSKYEQPVKDSEGIFVNYTKTNGLSDNSINNITEDQSGNIWIGTERGGVCKYNNNNLTKYTTGLGLAGNLVLSIMQDKAGNLWFGTESGGVSKYDGITFYNYAKAQGLPNGSVYSMLQDKTGNIWFGCFGAVSKFDGKSFTNYGTACGIPNAEVWNMMQDKAGNLWFTSWQGVTKFDGKSFAHYTTAQGLANDETLSTIQDSKGNIWFSAWGVNSFDGNHSLFTNYTSKEGLPLDEIPGIMEDAKGNIWLGFYGKGVGVFRDHQLTTFTTTQGIADNTIFKIREDTLHHRIWFATNEGLSVLRQGIPDAQGKDSILFENFNYKTGFSIKDFSFNFSLFIDNKGVVWAGSGDRKLIRFDYNALTRSNRPFRVQLQNVAINNENICWNILRKKRPGQNVKDSLAVLNEMTLTFGKAFTPGEQKNMAEKYHDLEFDSISPFDPIPQNLVLPHNMNNISFDFAAIAPAVGSQVKYQYRLEGYDKTWSPLTNKTSASFGNINEGTYTLRLRALNLFGVWGETSYTFRVLPPWYRTWWAYLIYALLFLTALLIFSKWRERNLRNEKEMLEGKVEARTNELKSTLENLKSTQTQLIQSEKMASLGELTAGIAHEIQNPLNFVNNFSDLNKELLAEMQEEMEKGNIEDAKAIATDLIVNEDKISYHGKRAESIVKGMLLHSGRSAGQKELTDVNALLAECLRLSYQGFRVSNQLFNVTLKTDLDNTMSTINIVPQDLSRVFLNLCNNAFYAVEEKTKKNQEGYEPAVTVSTIMAKDKLQITVRDNGTGIPEKIIDKIFQPFFTTKPTGHGVGLGLSLCFDIIKSYGGELKVDTKEGEYASFIILLPMNT